MTILLKDARSAAQSSLPKFEPTEESQYLELCKGFPLAVIDSVDHNQAALRVLSGLAKRENDLNTGGLTYMWALSRFVGDFEAVHYKQWYEVSVPGPEMLEYLIETSGRTQAEVARAVGIDRQNICNYIKGRRALSKEVRLKLCKLFGMGKDIFEYSPTKTMKL